MKNEIMVITIWTAVSIAISITAYITKDANVLWAFGFPMVAQIVERIDISRK